ncbi:MAG: ABC transporter ATP-binding protein [Anaerovoracaceae bacterium]
MISIEGVSKRFGPHRVLDDISLQIKDGEIFGLTGFNGAGKTTLLKIINGIYRPDDDAVLVDGKPVYENECVKAGMFMMTEELFFKPQATIAEMEKFYRGYYPGWQSGVYRGLMEIFGLQDDRKISGFSKGMMRQTGLMTAFASGAGILLLDEAFDGLDIGVRRTMRSMLRSYVAQRRAAVVITSHNLQELEECVDRFGMINEAHLVCDMTVEEVRAQGSSLEEYFLQGKEPIESGWEELFRK